MIKLNYWTWSHNHRRHLSVSLEKYLPRLSFVFRKRRPPHFISNALLSREVISQSATEKGANDTRSVCGGKIKEHDSVVLKFSSDVVFWGPKLNRFNRKVKSYVNGSAEENVFLARKLKKRIELIKKQTQLTSLIFYFNASTDGEISEIVTKLARTCPLVSVFLHLYR